MMTRARNLAIGAAVAAAVALSGCAAPGAGATGDPKPNLVPLPNTTSGLNPANAPRWPSLLHSGQKIFGVSLTGAPSSMAPVSAFARRVHKAPDLVEYYQDWADPFDPVRATRACSAGMLPMLTWESWDWQDRNAAGTAVAQPSYAPSRIAAGDFDSYLEATARAVKSVNCTMVIRLDQEPNGGWYPWGLGTAGMNNTPADYVAMWRHVWQIFHAAGVRNVRWCWSPNTLSLTRPYPLRALYPGSRYVDAVGIDGYLYRLHDTPRTLFAPVMAKLQTFAADKPWLVAETGVSTVRQQPSGIRSLLSWVANSSRLTGLVYLDAPAHRANWAFDSRPASLQAFRQGINHLAYGGAPR